MLRNHRRVIMRILAVWVVIGGLAAAGYAGPQAKPAPAGKQAPAATATKAAPAKPAPAQAAPAKVTKPVKATKAAPAKKAPPKAKAEAKKPVTPSLAAGRRDPFRSLLIRPEQQAAALPPGKKGLVIAQLSVDGIVRSPNGMIAVVTNPQKRVYFLREKDEVHNGTVERITAEGVLFKETAVDAFGKPFTHDVMKKLYPVPGEAR